MEISIYFWSGVGILLGSKNEVREKVLAARNGLSEDELSSKSDIITGRLVASEIFAGAGSILCFMDFRNEVRTGGIIKKCLQQGKRTALPLVFKNGTERSLAAYEIKDLEKDVRKGTYGILEPCSERLMKVQSTEIDLVIVPGVAFDLRRQRLGYGAGYYDRFLNTLRQDCVKIGIAFDIQVMDIIPVEAHDMKMDAIITETRII